MLWLPLVWPATVAALILFVIGLPLTRLLGLRGFASVAVAPAFALAVVGAASVVLPWLRVPWSGWGVLGVGIVTALVLFALRRATRRFRPSAMPPRRADLWLLTGFAVAALLIIVRTLAVIQAPDRISQTFDNVFHLNAIRWILDNGSASALQIGYLTNPAGPPSFYPTGWHAFASLVVQLSGASIPVAVNAVVLIVSAIIWPLGILLLSRTLFGRSPVLAITTGLIASSVPGFPLAMMDFGVLYPFQLGLALVPIALAITAWLLRVASVGDPLGTAWSCVALAATLAAITIVHPGALVAWLALSGAIAVVFVVQRWRAETARGARMRIAGFTLLYLVIAAAMVYVLRPPGEARTWGPEMSVNAALVKLMTASPWYSHAALVVAIGVLLGVAAILRARTPAAVAMLGVYIVAAILFVISASAPFPLRDVFTAPWYNNIPRLAAILSVTFVPIAAYGFASAGAVCAAAVRSRGWSPAALRRGAAALAVIGVIALQIGPLSAMSEAQRVASWSYALTDDSPLLSTDEAALLSRLDQHVPEDATIAGSPWTGTSVAYALADRRVLMPHILMVISEEIAEINDGLADAAPGSAVCAAMEQLDVRFVLDFGSREVHGADHDFPGFDDLQDSGAVRLVDSEGDARLYEVTACGR